MMTDFRNLHGEEPCSLPLRRPFPPHGNGIEKIAMRQFEL